MWPFKHVLCRPRLVVLHSSCYTTNRGPCSLTLRNSTNVLDILKSYTFLFVVHVAFSWHHLAIWVQYIHVSSKHFKQCIMHYSLFTEESHKCLGHLEIYFHTILFVFDETIYIIQVHVAIWDLMHANYAKWWFQAVWVCHKGPKYKMSKKWKATHLNKFKQSHNTHIYTRTQVYFLYFHSWNSTRVQL